MGRREGGGREGGGRGEGGGEGEREGGLKGEGGLVCWSVCPMLRFTFSVHILFSGNFEILLKCGAVHTEVIHNQRQHKQMKKDLILHLAGQPPPYLLTRPLGQYLREFLQKSLHYVWLWGLS